MDNKIKNLIQVLESKTLNKNAIWSMTSGNNEFKIEINNATITTDMWFYDDLINYDFVILNKNGDTVERLTVNESEKYTEEYQIITKFYEIVKNSYYRVDETINDILFELNNSEKIGGGSKK